METKTIQTDKAPAAIGPYSQAVLAGSLLFVSGQLGLIPETGEMAGPDLASQARQALTNLQNILEAGGTSLSKVAAVDVFLSDIGDFAEFNGIYQEFFSEDKPARAVIAVKGLPKNALVEIKCVAMA